MRAITIYQPWASLLACGAKAFETRSWRAAVGPIAIHAAAKDAKSIMMQLPHAVQKAMFDSLYAAFGITSGALELLPRGCIIATAELVECWEVRYINDNSDPFMTATDRDGAHFLTLTSREKHFGDYTPGRYAWELRNVHLLDTPIPAKGKQGLWRWEGVA